MTIEEELVWLREEKKLQREHLAQRDELIQQHHGTRHQPEGMSNETRAPSQTKE